MPYTGEAHDEGLRSVGAIMGAVPVSSANTGNAVRRPSAACLVGPVSEASLVARLRLEMALWDVSFVVLKPEMGC